MAKEDRRVTRTRAALIHAFDDLVLSGRGAKIRVADIVENANVGRSTFYDHYAGADDIHMAALARPFATLADAAAGSGDEGSMAQLLAHFWENRRRARQTLEGRTGDKTARLLVGLIEERLARDEGALTLPLRLAARQLGEAALSPLRGWIFAEAPCTPEALASAICAAGRALRAALRSPGTVVAPPLPAGRASPATAAPRAGHKSPRSPG